jgi:lipoate---protein ligase
MLCISHQGIDPYFNIASEEYLLKNFSEDIFMVYQNESAIIVGKHQNTFAEINHWFVREKNLKVIRRLSGGGTVFHDMGNLNFCFIRNGQEGNLIDFKKFTQPIIEVLRSLDVPAESSGRNDLIIHGLKFSGNAEHVYKNRTLHHGTLLFSSQLNDLGEALRVVPDRYEDRAVKSVRSKVTNISDYFLNPISLDAFRDILIGHVVAQSPDAVMYQFSETDRNHIQSLVEEKYHTWEWNYGYSPRFTIRQLGYIQDRLVEIECEIEKGVVKRADIKMEGQPMSHLSQSFSGILYKEDMIEEKLLSVNETDTAAWLRLLL